MEGPHVRIALAAPTGKAAARLSQEFADQAAVLGLPLDLAATTLHRLLGWRRGSRSRFRHDASNSLPHDIVIVDEASMLSLTKTARLLEAMPLHTRLIMVGDPDQLTSEDADAVLADVLSRPIERDPDGWLAGVASHDLAAPGEDQESEGGEGEDEHGLDEPERDALGRGVIRLRRGRRFNRVIGALAEAVRVGDLDNVQRLLAAGGPVSLHAPGDLVSIRDEVTDAGVELVHAARAGDQAAALAALGRHRLVCAHREGIDGVSRWSVQAQDWITSKVGLPPDASEFYAGQPLLVTANDYDLDIYNGEIGVIVDSGGRLTTVIDRGPRSVIIDPHALAYAQTVYAMTIHRSQGSQYESVTVVLPEQTSPLLTRQLLYTAVTRARHHVRIVASDEALAIAVTRQARRASGLRRTLQPPYGR